MLVAAEVLERESSGKALTLAVSLLRSGRRLSSLLDSLLEYNNATLGNGMALVLAQADLTSPCQEEEEMMRLAFPNSTISFRASGDTSGLFDVSRVREALANLIFNAAQHSVKGAPIEMLVQGTQSAVEISVENLAEPIPQDRLAQGLSGHLPCQRAGIPCSPGVPMKPSMFTQWSLATLLATAMAVSHAQSTSGNTTGNASGGAGDATAGADKPRRVPTTEAAKAPKQGASNPGTTGGRGNRSGTTKRDGASFSAPRPGAATSAPTGTGWD